MEKAAGQGEGGEYHTENSQPRSLQAILYQ